MNYVYVYVYVHIYMYMYICIYIYVYVYIYMYMYLFQEWFPLDILPSVGLLDPMVVNCRVLDFLVHK